MATAVKAAAARAASTPRLPLAKCGCSTSATPAMPIRIATIIFEPGKWPYKGHDSTATQSGKVFVKVTTSATGSCAKAKNVQTIEQLPATLRTQRRHGQKTSVPPLTRVRIAPKRATKPARKTATICQSQESSKRRSVVASTAMRVKEKLPQSIHRYGRKSVRNILER